MYLWQYNKQETGMDESESSLLSTQAKEDECQIQSPQIHNRLKILYSIIGFLCIFITAYFIAFYKNRTESQTESILTNYCYCGFTTLPPTHITILRNKTFEARPSDETNVLWRNTVPGVTGWVEISNPRQYNLPQGIPAFNRSGEVYITTWGHQHHCLKILRLAFWDLILGQSLLVGTDINDKDSESSAKLAHLMHCFDYLRQTVACDSDMTLEGRAITDDPFDFDIDGYNVEHKCKNKDAVGRFLLEHVPVGLMYENFD
ncbi:hypothetical protein F5884DRAFT_747035 [Xylogone sp. PMI_703]|nr:hypothetical protein F5884DRAFT_747035 [Xylogone sp. PMI_703]